MKRKGKGKGKGEVYVCKRVGGEKEYGASGRDGEKKF